MTELPRAADVSALHDRLLAHAAWPSEEPAPPGAEVWRWIQTNHRFNSRLWAEEDLARRTTVGDAEIAANKRAIDRYNQARNDATERVDEILLVALGLVDAASARTDVPVSTAAPGARLSSETAGSMIDRMSILALKIHAMRQQSARADADDAHRAASGVKLGRLEQQRTDLASCLDALLADSAAGRAAFKVYRQFKMYNDPRFNPALVAEAARVALTLAAPVRLLIVKTSSMGDVVHALPVVADVRRRHPQAEIDWLVEAPFAAIAQLHPGVRRVLPMAWRRWRDQLGQAATWREMKALRAELRREPYDLVLDLQGLLKSALWARQAIGPVAGYDGASAREPLAAWVYQRKAAVPRDVQAVLRNRLLAAAHLGLDAPDDVPYFGVRAPAPSWAPRGAYSVLIPNASRQEKLWPERHWVAVGRRLHERGLPPVVLWGRDEEQTLAERIAAGCEGDVVPYLLVGEMASVLARAQQVVGLDTGFTHLAAAFGRPTLGIYCDHDPGLAGITGPGRVASVGGKFQVPGKNEVLALLEQQMAE